jgi:hypothetical protein
MIRKEVNYLLLFIYFFLIKRVCGLITITHHVWMRSDLCKKPFLKDIWTYYFENNSYELTLRYTGAFLVTRTYGLGLRDPKLNFFFLQIRSLFLSSIAVMLSVSVFAFRISI